MTRLLPLVLVLGLAACDTLASGGARPGVPDRTDVDVLDLSHDATALPGTWDLVTVTPSGECLGDGCSGTRTAEAAGLEARLTFRADGTAEYRYGGDVFADGVYAVRPRVYENGTQSEVPHLLIGDREYVFGLDGDDRLYLEFRYVDGDLLEFERR